MSEVLADAIGALAAAAQGPEPLRVLMQAVVAVAFAARDGLREARRGIPADDVAPSDDPTLRRVLVRDRRISLAEVLITFLAIDIACQTLILGFRGGGQPVAIVLAIAAPLYLAVRGMLARAAAPRPINRATR